MENQSQNGPEESQEPSEVAPKEPEDASESASVETEQSDYRSELDQKNKEADEFRDKYLRACAELENFKKRAAKEKANWIKYSNEELLRECLTILDNISRAKTNGEPSPELAKWVEGISLTIKQFGDILAQFNVTPIKAQGTHFDPSIHQAMAHLESDEAEGTVVEEYQKGYLLHDRVLRPALVAVAKKKLSN